MKQYSLLFAAVVFLVFSPKPRLLGNEFRVTNESNQKIYIAFMCYVPKGSTISGTDSRDRTTRSTVDRAIWRFQGWWELAASKSVSVYQGDQEYVWVHIRTRDGGVVVPRDFADKEWYAVNLNATFDVHLDNDTHAVRARWKPNGGNRWNTVHYRDQTSMLRSRDTKWKSVRFYKIEANTVFRVRR